MARPLIALDADGVLLDFHLGYAGAWQRAFGAMPAERDPLAYWPIDRWSVEPARRDRPRPLPTPLRRRILVDGAGHRRRGGRLPEAARCRIRPGLRLRARRRVRVGAPSQPAPKRLSDRARHCHRQRSRRVQPEGRRDRDAPASRPSSTTTFRTSAALPAASMPPSCCGRRTAVRTKVRRCRSQARSTTTWAASSTIGWPDERGDRARDGDLQRDRHARQQRRQGPGLPRRRALDRRGRRRRWRSPPRCRGVPSGGRLARVFSVRDRRRLQPCRPHGGGRSRARPGSGRRRRMRTAAPACIRPSSSCGSTATSPRRSGRTSATRACTGCATAWSSR